MISVQKKIQFGDVTCMTCSGVDRATFEELAAEGLGAIEAVLKECLDASGWTPDDVYAVEIVGGSTRIPAIKNRIQVWPLALCFISTWLYPGEIIHVFAPRAI